MKISKMMERFIKHTFRNGNKNMPLTIRNLPKLFPNFSVSFLFSAVSNLKDQFLIQKRTLVSNSKMQWRFFSCVWQIIWVLWKDFPRYQLLKQLDHSVDSPNGTVFRSTRVLVTLEPDTFFSKLRLRQKNQMLKTLSWRKIDDLFIPNKIISCNP